ncbi:MAG TPA: hypothetical protein VMZ04_07835, partial [Anaerolineae bacterium]|nr:hypothetical protein [Anaerolineae bacterium]
MFNKIVTVCLIFNVGISAVSFAQSLDGKPYTPGVDPDINMNMGSWKDSMPVHTHGSLVECDILTKGDPLNPSAEGAVLKYMKRFTRASLDAHGSTQ